MGSRRSYPHVRNEALNEYSAACTPSLCGHAVCPCCSVKAALSCSLSGFLLRSDEASWANVNAQHVVKTETPRNAALLVLHPPFRCTSRLKSRIRGAILNTLSVSIALTQPSCRLVIQPYMKSSVSSALALRSLPALEAIEAIRSRRKSDCTWRRKASEQCRNDRLPDGR